MRLSPAALLDSVSDTMSLCTVSSQGWWHAGCPAASASARLVPGAPGGLCSPGDSDCGHPGGRAALPRPAAQPAQAADGPPGASQDCRPRGGPRQLDEDTRPQAAWRHARGGLVVLSFTPAGCSAAGLSGCCPCWSALGMLAERCAVLAASDRAFRRHTRTPSEVGTSELLQRAEPGSVAHAQ